MKRVENKESKWVWIVAHLLGLMVILTTVLCYLYLKKDAGGSIAVDIEFNAPVFNMWDRIMAVVL